MLTRRENDVMRVVYDMAHVRGICLVSPAEIIASLPPKRKCSEEQVETVLKELALDDYFQLLSSERKGEKMYVISLHAVGYAYKREFTQRRRNYAFKIGWAILSALIAFAVGLLLKRIF